MCTSFVLCSFYIYFACECLAKLHCFCSLIYYTLHLKITTIYIYIWKKDAVHEIQLWRKKKFKTKEESSLKLFIYFSFTFQWENVYRSKDCSFRFASAKVKKQSGSIAGTVLLQFHFMLNLPPKSVCWSSIERKCVKGSSENWQKRANQKGVKPFCQVPSKWQWIPHIGSDNTHTHNPFV